MSYTPASIAGVPARPTVEVRLAGQLIRRVTPGAADSLVARGWAESRRTGRRRYIALTDQAPLSAFASWTGKDGTVAMRADQTCKTYGAGQLMGDPRAHREFSNR